MLYAGCDNEDKHSQSDDDHELCITVFCNKLCITVFCNRLCITVFYNELCSNVFCNGLCMTIMQWTVHDCFAMDCA